MLAFGFTYYPKYEARARIISPCFIVRSFNSAICYLITTIFLTSTAPSVSKR